MIETFIEYGKTIPTPETDDRLVAVKNNWDPEHLFQLNHNVEPTE